jgi:hypothetical protein
VPVLSAANVVQAKVGSQSNSATAAVTLDNPTQPGGTVRVEMFGPVAWPGMPDGWEFDVYEDVFWVFRYCGGPGGETSWTWDFGIPNDWHWRVTEWDTVLDPVSPFEAAATNTASGSGITSVSSGTSAPNPNSRPETVALVTHLWIFSTSPTRVVTWSGWTNGFTERGNSRVSLTGTDISASWSWLFNSATGGFGCVASVSNSAPNASDVYYGVVVVYAATQPVGEVPGMISVT